MNVQQIEEMNFGDGYSNELARIHAQVRTETRIKKAPREKINELTANGYYVAVSRWEVFCPWTDAFLGYGTEIALVTRCSEEAEEFVTGEDISLYYPEA